MPLQNSVNAVIVVLTYLKVLGARSHCEGSKHFFIALSSLTDFETRSCSFHLCLEVESYSENDCSILHST